MPHKQLELRTEEIWLPTETLEHSKNTTWLNETVSIDA